MGKQINKLSFWKERIETAAKKHFSVYVTSEEDWSEINRIHSGIIRANITKTSNVLDAGCGYGRASEWILNYTGVDFSPDFIEMAKKGYPRAKFLQGDLKDLPFKDQEFDWAVCISIKQMVEDNLGFVAWQEMQVELMRVAKKVLILEYTEPGKYKIL